MESCVETRLVRLIANHNHKIKITRREFQGHGNSASATWPVPSCVTRKSVKLSDFSLPRLSTKKIGLMIFKLPFSSKDSSVSPNVLAEIKRLSPLGAFDAEEGTCGRVLWWGELPVFQGTACSLRSPGRPFEWWVLATEGEIVPDSKEESLYVQVFAVNWTYSNKVGKAIPRRMSQVDWMWSLL